MRSNKKLKQIIVILIFTIVVSICTFFNSSAKKDELFNKDTSNKIEYSFDLRNIPQYNGKPYIIINKNIPYFTKNDYSIKSFEKYSKLDYLGRCGIAYANICKETMPANGDKRGNISSVKPTGWKQAKYNGEYLYNRCHLIGWQLSDEDDNKLNLITGTNYFNVLGMLPFENMVDDYFENKENENNHVLYRVTPIFKDNNYLASGVQMEAYSVEDNGDGICFNVYIYNVQPGININYTTGESSIY